MGGELSDRASVRPSYRGTQASAAERRSTDAAAALILDILATSPAPLGAYDVLERLRLHGRCDAPKVYRALARLVQNRMARRLETLKAYVARRSEPTLLADVAEDTSALFIICDSCRSVGEIDDPELGRLIGHRATAARFTPRTGTIEILGLCALSGRGTRCGEARRDGDRPP